MCRQGMTPNLNLQVSSFQMLGLQLCTTASGLWCAGGWFRALCIVHAA